MQRHKAKTPMSKLPPDVKVFGIGLSKTGTSSLCAALNLLGIRSIHYPSDQKTFEELSAKKYRLTILESYRGVAETIAPFYAELDQEYPGSKFILTVRDQQQWLDSVENHWQFMREWCKRDRIFKQFTEFFAQYTFGTVDFDRKQFQKVYEQHLNGVMYYFSGRANDLLVIDICHGEGWNTLCPFLGADVREISFPHVNRRNEKNSRLEWMHKLDLASEDLNRVIPPDESYVLIDQNQLAGSSLSEDSRCRRFLEQDGQCYGPPANSESAISETKRLQARGTNFLVIAWPSFWWLEYYKDWRSYLGSHSDVVLENDRLVVLNLAK
jgi:hypothetical protein